MMRTIDLGAGDPAPPCVSCDVCIVGAGAAGLLLASMLARAGFGVVVLDVGGRVCSGEKEVGCEAVVEGGTYRATSDGRAFGLGGTTSLWGGQLVPHSTLDVRSVDSTEFNPWRHVVDVVVQQEGRVGALLGILPLAAWFDPSLWVTEPQARQLRARELDIVTADWLPFRRRNLSFLLNDLRRGQVDVTVILNAAASSWEIGNSAGSGTRISRVTARSLAGRSCEVKARAFVIAAGAIESSRILLEMARGAGELPFRKGAAVGKALSDHLSCAVAQVVPGDSALCARMFGPRFRDGRMRTLRFIERKAPPHAPRGFFHVLFDNEGGGFAIARKVLRGLQSRRNPGVSLREGVGGVHGLMALAWFRFALMRLHIPKGTPARLQLDIEQHPDARNCVVLGDEVDAFGRPVAVVRWGVSNEDTASIRGAARRFLASWPSEFPRLEASEEWADGVKPHDVYHPVGSCRMGLDRESVVGPDLKVHGSSNLYVLSTAVLPSAGTANPTFSMLCLGAGLADHLTSELRREPG